MESAICLLRKSLRNVPVESVLVGSNGHRDREVDKVVSAGRGRWMKSWSTWGIEWKGEGSGRERGEGWSSSVHLAEWNSDSVSTSLPQDHLDGLPCFLLLLFHPF